MTDSQGEQVREQRVLMHRRANVERVVPLPMGAPPLHRDAVDHRKGSAPPRRDIEVSLLDRLGRDPSVFAEFGVASIDAAERQRREQQRSSWMRYLMNVHLMWVD